MGERTSLKKHLKKFAEEILADYPLKEMYLFGSRAGGKVRKDSDIDLLLVSTGFIGKRRMKRSPPLYLKWKLDYPVDFLCLTPEEFSKKKKMIGVVQETVKTGIKII